MSVPTDACAPLVHAAESEPGSFCWQLPSSQKSMKSLTSACPSALVMEMFKMLPPHIAIISRVLVVACSVVSYITLQYKRLGK